MYGFYWATLYISHKLIHVNVNDKRDFIECILVANFRCTSTWRTILPNFILIRFETTRSTQQEQWQQQDQEQANNWE